MKSLINNLNSHKIPFSLIIGLIFVYICPNTRFLSVGENSFFPIFIFLLGFSFFKEKEIYIYTVFGLICLIFPIYSTIFKGEFSQFSLVSSLMSLYIMTVPILSSITLGRIIGSRFSYLSDKKIKKEFKLLLVFIFLLFCFSALAKTFFPSLLYFFLHAGRTSHERLAFFFTEPSQASSILIALFTISYYLLTKNKFSEKIGKEKFRLGLLILFFTLIMSYLSQPLTLIAQIIIILFLFTFFITLHFLYIVFKKKLLSLRLIGLKKSYNQFLKLIIFFSLLPLLIYYLFTNIFERVIGLINFITREGLFLGLMISAGNRFYYAFTSLIQGLLNPISLPGDWVGQFKSSLLNILGNYSLIPPDAYGLLQLYKTNPLLLKPSGWLYFNIYDLGIFVFLIFTFFMLKKYLTWTSIGIIRCDYSIILLFSIQISLWIIPLLPSTPSVFFPILISAAIMQFKKNRIETTNTIE